MAERSVQEQEAWKTTIPCRYYANGMCREGDRCQYLHEEDTPQISPDGEQSKSSNQADSETNISGASNTSDSDNKSTANSSGTTEAIGGGDETSVNSSSSLREADDTSSISSTISRGSQVNSEPIICPYFQQGCCRFGDNCRNRHEAIEHSANSSSCSGPDDLSESSLNNTVIEASSSDFKASVSDALPSSSTLRDTIEETLEEKSIQQLEAIENKTRLRVNAPEFIPGKFVCPAPLEPSTEDTNNDVKEASTAKTWAQVVNSTASVLSPFSSLCPYAEAGDCPYAENCNYIHGDVCEFCGNACLHPTNGEQRKSHTDECIKQHEREMELAFAVARSKDKQCGVCFEVVVDKNPASEQRFGILPNCNHCFCLACIRKWRQAKQFENKIIRACPECRVTSDFVCPSMHWVDTKEEKDKLIMAYKDALSNKQCKYFKQGRGKCPFGNKCFYLHAYPDGTKVDTGPPIRRHRQNADGETDVLQTILWDFLDERDNRWLYSLDDIDIMAFLSGSDDEELSDSESVVLATLSRFH